LDFLLYFIVDLNTIKAYFYNVSLCFKDGNIANCTTINSEKT